MAGWIDFVSLAVTLSVTAAVVLGLLHLGRATSRAVAATKESLKSRGVDVSNKGISVKTNRRLDRDDYLDATQRGFVKAYNHSTYGPGAGVRSHSVESLHNHNGNHSSSSSDSEKARRNGAVSGAMNTSALKKTVSSQ